MSKVQATTQPIKSTSASVSGSDVTTTGTTIIPVTGLSIAANANRTYRILASLLVGCDNTGGIQLGINGPAGAAVKSGCWVGIATALTTIQVQRLASIGNVAGTAFNRVNLATGVVSLTAYITTSSTAGSITVVFKSATSGNLSTVFIGSTFDITEIT